MRKQNFAAKANFPFHGYQREIAKKSLWGRSWTPWGLKARSSVPISAEGSRALCSTLLANASSLCASPLQCQVVLGSSGWLRCKLCSSADAGADSALPAKGFILRLGISTLGLLCQQCLTSPLWLTACEWAKQPVARERDPSGGLRGAGCRMQVPSETATMSTTFPFDTCWATRFLAGGIASDLYATFPTRPQFATPALSQIAR